MSETKECLIERAKLMEHVERYDEMAAAMKKTVELTPVLSEEERHLFGVAYHKVTERHLDAWRILNIIVQKTEGSERRQQLAREYRAKVESELRSIIADARQLLNQHLIPNAENYESKDFYQQTSLRYNGYLADITPEDHSEGIVANQQSIDYPINDLSGYKVKMTKTKKSLVELAKLAEEVEHYDDMAATMKNVAETTPAFSEEERNLLAVSYQNVVERRLKAWRILNRIVQKTEACEERQQMAKAYCEKVENELKSILADLHLLTKFLIPNAANPASEVCYLHMKEKFCGYFAEVAPGDFAELPASAEGSSAGPENNSSVAENTDNDAEYTMCSTQQTFISDLADEDLTNIVKQLPPYERLLVSEVSKRWYAISRIPWYDVLDLDLTPIPGENIGAIVKQCPNLRTVFAKDKNLKPCQLNILTRTNLSSLKLYQCSSVIRESEFENSGIVPLFSAVFSDNLPNASWTELVLCCLDFVVDPETENDYFRCALPPSVERLQLNGLNVILPRGDSILCSDGDLSTSCLRPLRQLTCLILCASSRQNGFATDWDFLPELGMNSLRELCVDFGDLDFSTFYCWFDTLAVDLPLLEILFLRNVVRLTDDEALQLAKMHPALRVLCIAGSFQDECTFPVRRRFPNGFSSDPVPLLHVFVGKEASEKIIFTKSSVDALEIHPITEPLPAFLERPEIVPLFEGVWITAQIKEGAKHGSEWWKCEGDTTTSFRTADDV